MSNIKEDIEVLNWLDEIGKRPDWKSETIKSYKSTSRKYAGEHL